MSKGKLAKFADMASYPHVFECPFKVNVHSDFPLRGHWRSGFFHNDNPIVLELGCGRGEYTVGLARRYPERNFIGVDIKGARMWSGATESLKEGLTNVAFLRTNIEIIDRFFAPGEVQEIWLTFSDPQMKKATKRLTSTYFLCRYRRFLTDGGLIHLKTDSNFLFTYTKYVCEVNQLPVEVCTEDLYGNSQFIIHNSQFIIHNSQLAAPGDKPEALMNVDKPEAIMNYELSIMNSSIDLSIRTYYEQMWLDRGITIKYLRFHLPATLDGRPTEDVLVEPDVEIPLDDYRSYSREKRSSLTTAR